MPLSLDQIDKTIELIDELTDPSSNRYGKLLNWQNPPDPFWHYGIGLSGIHIFDTGRGHSSGCSIKGFIPGSEDGIV